MLFLGTFNTNFSGKGRVILPKKLRQNIKTDEVTLVRGLEGCIWGFDKSTFEDLSQKQLEIPLDSVKGRSIRRYFFSGVEVVALDKQNRFVIPDFLLEHAGLGGSLCLIGAGDHFEVWDPDKWQEALRRSDQNY